MNILINHPWRGNVRELRNAVEHAVVLADHSYIQPDDLPETVLPQAFHPELPILTDMEWSVAKMEFERTYLITLLEKLEGNLSAVSVTSGIPRENLYRKCSTLKIDPNDFRRKQVATRVE
jgi:DNA-binding NtrC family response regulator